MPPSIPTFGYIALCNSVNKIIRPNKFIRDTFFNKKVYTLPTKDVQVDVIVGGRKIAPFVARGKAAVVVGQTGKKTTLVEPPSIRMKKGLTAADLLMNRAPGTIGTLDGNTGGDAIAQARQVKIGIEQADMLDIEDRTEEFMCCQAISYGKISISQPEVEFEIDYQTPATHLPTLAGGSKWTSPNDCTPIDDIIAWKKLVKKATGKLPTRAIMTSDIWALFLASKQVQAYLDKLKINIGSIDTTPNILTMGAEKVARILNIDFYTYDEYYDANGVVTSMIPEDRFVLIADAADVRFYYGLIEDLDAAQAFLAKYFSKDWVEKDPSIYWMLVEGHPLPTLNEAECIVSAKVK